MASLEQIEAEKAALMEEEAAMCQQVQRDNPDDAEIQQNAYYHPDVQAIADRLRAKIAEWHSLLPDDHPEMVARGSHPAHLRDLADMQMRASLDRLHKAGELDAGQHKRLHAAINRTSEIGHKHYAALKGVRNGAA